MNKKVLSLALALILALSVSLPAFAAWPQHNGGDSHNGQITNGTPPIGANPTMTSIKMKHINGTPFNGIDVQPIMETAGSDTFAYVLYDGGVANGASEGGARMAKIRVSDAPMTTPDTDGSTLPASSVVWDVQLNETGGFQLSTPYLDGDVIYVGVTDFYNSSSYSVGIKSVDKSTGAVTSLAGTQNAGQTSTPITKYGNYLYFGTYNGGGRYYQVDLTDSSVNTFTANGDNFYWAGAYADGGTVYFGSDNGKLYYLDEDDFGGTPGSDNTITLSGAGNVRSSISTDGTNLYFTSQGTQISDRGSLWKVTKATATAAPTATSLLVQSPTSTAILKSTSTPAISANGKIYIGFYSGFSDGGILAVPVNNFTQGAIVRVANRGAVQCSPIVYTPRGSDTDYIYFATNAMAGKGFLCSYTNAGVVKEDNWGFDGLGGGLAAQGWADHYSLQGFAADNGYVVYGDDSNGLYIFH